ncbi:hypothetical protein [Pedosphaera parvula]|uniref:Intracellular proteinase inhibitor BsuPI domain-containing protein n=1 Tax=Pedosphaera parvula (strain Ellin514) TaxID=320771 RepID=B9XT08_PEDPL|nr:hypothetical protein [Pedosphaera parvula]EEF57018.1 hypothetical protein Cflav_PD0053 [Pedosphaera parvula Ellin514]
MKRILAVVVLGCVMVAGGTSYAEGLAVDVVPTVNREEAWVYVSGEVNRRFYVVVSNVSDRPQRVYEDWNSWGYFSLSFEVRTAQGKVVKITRSERDWSKNFASTYTIPAGGHYVLPVQWSTNEWQNLNLISGAEQQPVRLKAVFEIPEAETNTYRVWTGRVESVPREVRVNK